MAATRSSSHLAGRRLLPRKSYLLLLEKGQLISGVILPVKHIQGTTMVQSEGEIPHHNFFSMQPSWGRNMHRSSTGGQQDNHVASALFCSQISISAFPVLPPSCCRHPGGQQIRSDPSLVQGTEMIFSHTFCWFWKVSHKKLKETMYLLSACHAESLGRR